LAAVNKQIFTNLDLSDVLIPGADVTGGCFFNTNFSFADLRGVNFSRCRLSKSKFHYAKMDQACFEDGVTLEAFGRWTDASLSPDGKHIGCCSQNGFVHLYEAASGKLLLSTREEDPFTHLSFSPDGKYLACITNRRDERTIRVYHTLTLHRKSQALDSHITDCLRFSPNSSRLVSHSKLGVIRVRSFPQLDCLPDLGERCESAKALAFSPDGSLLASGSEEHKINIWNFETRRCIHSFSEHRKIVETLCFSPDGKSLASGSADCTVKIWSTAPFQNIFTLVGHTGKITCVTYSPDGKYVVSGARDFMIKL